MKRQPFSPVFPLAESIAEAFFWLFLWNFKEKASTIFWDTAFQFIKMRVLLPVLEIHMQCSGAYGPQHLHPALIEIHAMFRV
ncbi:hypothetical protein [uncultured Bilophila sp.]|uniref:hypothetical protein n=1 Tax=uncultured Bilophila sp. TaxID=529385 RepID=UPI00266FE713|nr:hypothetical protein [uncultured Bilophila sp.]